MLYFILICLNVSCLVNDHVYVIYVYNIIDIVQFNLNDINCGHVRKCVMRSIIFWTIYL